MNLPAMNYSGYHLLFPLSALTSAQEISSLGEISILCDTAKGKGRLVVTLRISFAGRVCLLMYTDGVA